jgi:hypothetical protein
MGGNVSMEEANKLLQAIEYLPMTICHAAAYIEFTGISIEAYLSRLETERGLLEVMDRQDVDTGRRDHRAPRSVVKALLVTYDLLERHNKLAAHLFYLFACFDRLAIPASIISTLSDTTIEQMVDSDIKLPSDLHMECICIPDSQIELECAIGDLMRLSLIIRTSDNQSYTMHRLVQAATTHRLVDEDVLRPFLWLSGLCLLRVTLPYSLELAVRLGPVEALDRDELAIGRRLVANMWRVTRSLQGNDQETTLVSVPLAGQKLILYGVGGRLLNTPVGTQGLE